MSSEANTILTERFLEFCDFAEKGFCWEGYNVSMSDIANGVATGIKERSKRWQPYTYKGKKWHIGRVIYFINDPSRITPISMDNDCHGSRIYPIPIIDDGHHRFAAILYLGLPKFEAYYSGRTDVLRYLQGKRKTKPK